MDLVRELDVSPWEALLLGVRLTAGSVMRTERKLVEVEQQSDGAEVTPPELKYWRQETRRERVLMVRTAKAAIDAGVAERLVRQVEMEGQLVAAALTAALDVLPLSAEQRMTALTAAQGHLFAISGTVVDAPSDRTEPPAGSADGPPTG